MGKSNIVTRNTLHDCTCEFCGQVLQASDEVWEEAKRNQALAAKLTCDCADAKHFAWKYRVIVRGADLIDEIVGKKSEEPMEEEIITMLHRCVSNIVKRKMISVTIGVNGKEKVTLKMTSKGIKCEREKKKTRNDEIKF